MNRKEKQSLWLILAILVFSLTCYSCSTSTHQPEPQDNIPPAQQDNIPPAPDPAPKSQIIEGTQWIGTDSDGGNWSYKFQPEGILCYKEPGMELPGQYVFGADAEGYLCNGVWEQSGKSLSMNVNNGAAIFNADINDEGKYMKGDGFSNFSGQKWTWTASLRNDSGN